MDQLEAVSPIDGRYHRQTKDLGPIFSEWGLINRRLKIEVEYLIDLSELAGVIRLLTEDEKVLLRQFADADLEVARIIKAIETKGWEGIPATNHDVKAVEIFLRHQFKGTSLEDLIEMIHFALTSEDVNNLAYALQLRDSIDEVCIPALESVLAKIETVAQKNHKLPMLARTHGQPAAPTTLGKEMMVYIYRLDSQLAQLRGYQIQVKLNGAVGNWSAHYAAFPNVDWQKFSRWFIDSLRGKSGFGFRTNDITTQIEPHDTYAELFAILSRINTILISFCQDMWRYISDNWIIQIPVAGEVGSSTMPQKINPIDFENGEGNLGISNALMEFFSRTLPISRLQRHLTDSTIIRNFGVAMGHALIGYKSIEKGMGKIAPNVEKIRFELENHPEVISEAIQTILRREKVSAAYDKLKEFTRGKKVTLDDLHEFIGTLPVRDEVKKELLAITPQNYIGKASEIAMGNLMK